MRRPDQVGLEDIPFLLDSGIRILKIEGRAMPDAYIAQATALYRGAIDLYRQDPERFAIPDEWSGSIEELLEARREYERKWHIA